jgi:NitT/TauT family transport system permease protein
MKKLIYPFGTVDNNKRVLVALFWVILFLGLFQVFHGKVIPSPMQVLNSLWTLVTGDDLLDNFIASLLTTLKSTFYSCVLTVILVYSSTIPFFKPLAQFVSKCRYLTLTGLVFVFTQMNAGGDMGSLKLSLLIFGITPFLVTSFLSVVDSTPKQEVYKGYVNGLGSWGTLLETVIIGKLDILLEVIRQNFAISWMMITMVEGYAMSEGGIGTMLIKSTKYLTMAPVFAMLIIVILTGLLFDLGLSKLRLLLFPYLKANK